MQSRLRLAEGWSSFFLLMVALMSAAIAVSSARWTDGLGILATAAIFGLTGGLLLAKSRFPSTIAHLFSLVYGLFTVGYLVAGMVDEPVWHKRVLLLGERFVTWLTKATSGGTSRDSLMFVLLLASLFWLLGHIAAWYTFRYPRLWRVLIPLSLTMLVNYYAYTDPRIATRSTTSLTPFLAAFLLATLLYVVRTNVHLRELEWRNCRVNYSTDVRVDFVRSGTILASIALLAMVIAPGANASPHIEDLWSGIEEARDNMRTTVSRLFASLDVRGRGVGNPFTNRTALGGPRSLGNEVLFDVRARSGRYWRAMVYDRYTGSSWISTDDHKLLLPPGETVISSDWQMRQEMTQTVAVYLPSSTQLFAAPEPVRVPAFSAQASITFDQGKVTSVSALYSRKTLRAGNVYQVVSSVSRADPDTLRTAGQDYPDWSGRRYLQLPDTVTDRTRALAQEITADVETVFDKAQAIEQYLRHNLRYDLSAPAPPPGQDFVDFVLFDLKRGYCDYYTTSFVVLARSVGIPARVAMGYAQDTYDDEAKAYRVRANNGHSWPEVLLPKFGWIQFEPTVILDPIDWPASPDPSAAGNSSSAVPYTPPDPRGELEDLLDEDDMRPGSGAYFPPQESSSILSPLFALVGLLVIAAVGAVAMYWVTEKQGMSGLNVVELAYTRMWRLAARLGVPAAPDQTPYERAEVLSALVPEGEPPIRRITGMYVAVRFGRANADSSEAGRQWAVLRPRLWQTWFQKKINRLQQKRQRRR